MCALRPLSLDITPQEFEIADAQVSAKVRRQVSKIHKQGMQKVSHMLADYA